MQTTSDPGTLQGLWGAVLLPGEDLGSRHMTDIQMNYSEHQKKCIVKLPPDVHQARHLVLRHDQLLAAKVGQGDVGWCGKKSVRGRLIRGKKTGRCWLMWEKIRKWSADVGKGKIRRDFTIWKSSGKLCVVIHLSVKQLVILIFIIVMFINRDSWDNAEKVSKAHVGKRKAISASWEISQIKQWQLSTIAPNNSTG